MSDDRSVSSEPETTAAGANSADGGARQQDAGEQELTEQPRGEQLPDGQPDSDGVPLDGGDVTDRRASNLLLGLRQDELAHLEDTAFEVERRYWLTPPYAYAIILENSETGEYQYRVVEPWLDENQTALYEHLSEDKLIDRLRYRVSSTEDVDRKSILREEAREILKQLPGYDVTEAEFATVLYYLRRDMVGLEKVDALMADPHLEEITCNGVDSPVYVDHRDYEWIETNIVFREEQLTPFVRKLAQRAGKAISTSSPIQETSLPSGERITLSLADVAPRGPNFSIRKYSETPFTPIHLIRFGTFSLDQMAYLWELIDQGESGLIVGGTNSGKTTTMNALSMFIPPRRKLVTIEDTRELTLPHENWTANLTREGFSDGDAEISMYDLLETTLRQSPDYLIVGEVRGPEARSMFQGMNTGHTTYSTLHADSVQTALSRLENQPMTVERNLIRELGFMSIQSRFRIEPASLDDPDEPLTVEEVEDDSDESAGDEPVDPVDEQSQVRRNTGIVEFPGEAEGAELKHRRVFDFDGTTDSHDQIAESHHIDRDLNSIHERRELLEHLLAEDITGYEYVSTILRAFMVDQEQVMEQVQSGQLDFSTLEAIEEGHAAE